MTAGPHEVDAAASVTAADPSRTVREHLDQDVLGWWERYGADDVHGGVRTCLGGDGEVLSEDRYTWSQGRWAWLCALVADEIDAGALTGDAAVWRARARHAADLLAARAVLPGGSTIFCLTRDGDPVPQEGGRLDSSVFADLFAVLGLAGAVRAGATEHLATAERVLVAAERAIHDRTAPTEPYPVPPGYRDLAGPMSLLHAAAELCDVGGGPEVRAVLVRSADTLVGPDGLLGVDRWWEMRPDDAAENDTLLARHVTPGHLLECLWMLVHAARTAPEIAVDPELLEHLALRALETGWDPEHGGLLRYTDRDGGRPRGRRTGEDRYTELLERTWDTKLWWVHAEALYATALLAQHCGSRRLERWYDRVRHWTLATFPAAGGAEWTQIRDRTGAPLEAVVALPLKDPMHVARSLALLGRIRPDATMPSSPSSPARPETDHEVPA
ncbi:AGE family epimerase/isomerase [Litorihabitans aurantiacus]|uniref:N-acylglucosamine 2-epimerase n=1 Tax=Litorihabitans aurantiacus TaxID=1930061 RepID=A0AA37XDU7_9MICO|nr:AGE family epimerase/isomerase [Litorihabitans aurantiacus]GMA31217.1 N-acylglucosamine 2-epimerase [Litorihabitans aurantiacus]